MYIRLLDYVYRHARIILPIHNRSPLPRVTRRPALAGHVLILRCMSCCPASCPNRPAFFRVILKQILD